MLLGVLVSFVQTGFAAKDVVVNVRSPRQLIEQHLAIGKTLLEEGNYAGALVRFRAVLQIDATHRDALRLMTKAQQQLEGQQAKAQREHARLRDKALALALQFAQEKANERARRDSASHQQLAQAREQKLKYLYNRGLRLYQQGDFQEAIDSFQQMVLVGPEHPLVRAAQRLIVQAETKQAETRARATAKLSPGGGALVSDLEQQLITKRIEIETAMKYAKIAMNERNYDIAIRLLQKILAQDALNRDAQQLLHQAQMAKLTSEEDRSKQQVQLDEQSMINEVIKAQQLPKAQQVELAVPAASEAARRAMNAKLQQPISLDFQDVALPDVLNFIADAANVSIIPSPQLDLKSRRVSLKVKDLPLELAIKYLAKSQSLAYRIESDAILLATADDFAGEPLETRVFFLQNGIGPLALKTAAIEANPAIAMTNSLKELIERSVPKTQDSKLVFDDRTGALVATNTSENLNLIAKLLSQLDVTPIQFLIEARFIEVNQNDLEQVGLESILTGNASLTKVNAADRTAGPGQQLNSGSGFKFPNLDRQGEGLNLTLQGVLTGTQFESVLHLLGEKSQTKTLSAPRVTALNNQTAQIRVVDEFRYPTRYEVSLVQFDINGNGNFNDAGETQFVNVPKDFQERDVGILLNVTPSVGEDQKTITLVLAPEVSGFNQFRNLGGGVTVPEFTSSQLTTSVVVEDGQTIVLGGLMKDATADTVTKVPVLGDLPFVGNMFRQKSTSSSRKNLLIFITAHKLAPRRQTT